MKPTNFIFLIFFCLTCNCFAQDIAYTPPLASEALPSPAKSSYALQHEQEAADRVKYSVMIGSHDFEVLEKEASKIIDSYSNKKISADDFIVQLYVLVPTNPGKGHIEDITQWTHSNPESYAAWYVLGRYYLNLTQAARGGKWARETSKEQFSEMYKYANLSQEALSKSLELYPKPMPSYRALIELDKYIYKAPNPKYTVNTDLLCKTIIRISYDLYSYFCIEENKNYVYRPEKDYEYLQAAIEADPDSSLIYQLYFASNTPRWGGSFEKLYSVFEQAKLSGLSKENLSKTEALLIEHQAEDETRQQVNNSKAEFLYEKSFYADPQIENLHRLYSAAYYAKKALKYDLAIDLYTRIIEIKPTESKALFERGVLYLEEKQDITQYFLDQIESAKLGNKFAQNNIGYFYLTGNDGFPINLEQAKAWLQLSANQGFDHARDKIAVVDAKLKQAKLTGQ